LLFYVKGPNVLEFQKFIIIDVKILQSVYDSPIQTPLQADRTLCSMSA